MNTYKMLLALSALCATATQAENNNAQYAIDIQAQPISGALRALAAQTGLQILVLSQDAANKFSPDVHGTLTNEQALIRILDDSGLAYKKVDERTVAVGKRAIMSGYAADLHSIRYAVSTSDPGASQEPVTSNVDTQRTDYSQQSNENKTAALEEIIVTATKQGAQDLQSTPVTVTAFSSEKLQRLGMENLNDIVTMTPGLDMQNTAPGRTQVIIRGVSLGNVSSGQPQNRATTGLYINDVPFEQNGINPDPELFDLERVEVLKGPQGSRFGSSAMAGALRYVTKLPDLNRVSGRAVVDASKTYDGGDESYDVKGAINIPLIDNTLGTRLMAYHSKSGGWIDNAALGHSNINTDRSDGVRLSALWRYSDLFSAHLMAQYQNMKIGYPPRAKIGVSSIFGLLPSSAKAYKTYTLEEESTKDQFVLSTLDLTWDFNHVTLTSVSGYIRQKYQDSRPGDMAEFLIATFGVNLPDPQFNDPFNSNRFSQEVRATVKDGITAGSTLGVFYSNNRNTYETHMNERGWDQYALDIYGMPADSLGCVPQHPDDFFCGVQRNREKQLSIFGELDLHPWQGVTFSAGGRRFAYVQHFDEQYGGFYNGGPTTKTQTFKENGFSPALGASYQTSGGTLWYASAAKGFRMGGVDDPVPDVCDAELAQLGLSNYTGVFKSDSLWTYELGAKGTFGNRATLNGAAFYTVWDQIQTSQLLRCGYPITQNASKQKIVGFELESRMAVTQYFSVELGGSYTHAYLAGDAPAIDGHDGDRAPFTPRVRFNGVLDYQHPLTDSINGFASLSFNYRSDSYTTYARAAHLPSTFTSNIRFGTEMGHFRVTAYVNNVTDRLILNDSNIDWGDAQNWSVGRPRTVGIELQADY